MEEQVECQFNSGSAFTAGENIRFENKVLNISDLVTGMAYPDIALKPVSAR